MLARVDDVEARCRRRRPDGRPPRARRGGTPRRCPRARPDTTATPGAGELAAELAREPGARRRCSGACRRSPPARRSSASRSPRANRTAGGPRVAAQRVRVARVSLGDQRGDARRRRARPPARRRGRRSASPPTSRPARLRAVTPCEQLAQPARPDRRMAGEQDRVAQGRGHRSCRERPSSGRGGSGVDAEAQRDGDVGGGHDVRGLSCRSATVRATRRTRCSPRAERRPLWSACASTSAASGCSGASSSSRSTGMAALVSTPRCRRDGPAPPAPARARPRSARCGSAPMRSVTDGRVTSTRRSNRSSSGPDSRRW